MEERDIDEIDLPLTIKVCVSPGFNDKALQEVGYSDTWAYFLGSSMYNDSVIGWAGHTETSEVFGNVSGVLEKVRNHNVNDIIKEVSFWTSNREIITLSLEQLKTPRLNYPYNCFSFDIIDLFITYDIIELFITFQNLENKTAEVMLRDTNVACNREVKEHNVFSKGDSIKLTDDKVTKAYMVEISKNVFVKEDPSKRCTEYPTDKFESYKECDDHFMRQLLDDISPDLLPVWLTDDLDSVTTFSIDNGSTSISKCKAKDELLVPSLII